MSPNPETAWKGVPASTTWSAMVAKEEAEWPPELPEEPMRWKLLIVVIDCSYGPRLHNPPRSIRALKAKLAAALGIEALSKQSGTGGAEAASAQAIVTGIEGPQRHLIEQDDDLCGFWDRVATNPGLNEDHEESRRASKTLMIPGLAGTMTTTWGSSHPVPTRSSSRSSQPNQPMPVSGFGMVPVKSLVAEMRSNSQLGSIPVQSHARNGEHRSSSGGAVDTSAFEARIHDLEEQCEEAEAKLTTCMQQLESSTAELEMAQHEVASERMAHAASQEKVAQLEELSAQLQDQNLGFIKTFEEQLETSRRDIKQEMSEQYQAVLDAQAKKVHEAEGNAKRLEGQLRVTLDKIKDLEAALRQERSNARRSEAALAGEHAKIEEMTAKIQSQAARLRQLEYYANSWERKVHELAEANAIKVLTEPNNVHTFRVSNFSRLRLWPKGRMVQSPEFKISQLGDTQIEFFPAGEVNSRPGWCSLRLRIPDGTRLRWRVKIGSRDFDVRDDHYDSRQWWNRYGIQCLNLCQAEELLPEVLPESDSVLIGMEVLEVISKPVILNAFAADEMLEVPRRPGTAPQRQVESPQLPPQAPPQVTVPSAPLVKRETARSQPQLPKPAHALAAGTASAAAAAAAFAVKSGNLPPAVAASRGLHRQRSYSSVRASVP
ncbi:unnamed protein product [Effrenium voratum]|uniref:MATH domain-containing protein n=1 Tax=Effrenium voratum TaxID=2562239 RepID=A0AA36MQ95_9DINO|nr:unnamed protein product [Effrenium voratum]